LIDNEEIRALQLLGLASYEAKAYLALIRTGPVSAGKLAFYAHVPRSKLYGTLRGLEQKGLVHVAPSKPETFTAVSPLAVLKAKAEEISDQAAAGLEIVQRLAEEYALKVNSSGLELPTEANELWHIDGRRHIYQSVGKMLRRAAKSVSYYATPAGLVRAYKAHADYLENVGKRGVTVRLLAQTTKEIRSVASELATVIKIRRTTKPLGANFVCIDGRELVVIENSPDDFNVEKGGDRAAWTTNKLLVQLYESLFEGVWENSSPIQ
jgi:sugar-specific transcriptional regulator TrmB